MFQKYSCWIQLETVYDLSFRNSFQLDTDQFQIIGENWPHDLSEILSQVKQGLGLEDKKVLSNLPLRYQKTKSNSKPKTKQ